jgi:hypothetical protein
VANVASWQSVALQCHANKNIKHLLSILYALRGVKKWRGTPQREKNKTIFNYMNKQLIIQLFENKDKSRRRCLYEAFQDKINTKTSRKFIAQMINKELARDDLITEEDIKYCRHYFKDEKGRKPSPNIPSATLSKKTTVQNQPVPTFESDGLVWSNPDDDNYQNSSIKSKFSK